MTREEVKKALVDCFKEVNVEELSNDTSRIRVETEDITKVFYLHKYNLVFLFYVRTDYALMGNTIANTFSYSQIKRIERTDKGIRFMLKDGTYISMEF